MSILAFKFLLTPLLMTAATLAARRWGAAVGGWIVGLPITSGPISLFLALEQGPDFAARAAVGTLLGINAVVATLLTYALLARRWPWPATTAASVAVFFMTTALLHALSPGAWPVFACTCGVLLGALAVLPPPRAGHPTPVAPWWDLPARSVAALAMMVTITWLAAHVGAEWSGLLSPFPVFTLVMAVFGHRAGHGDHAVPYARGVLASLFGFAAFFLVVALLLGRLGLPAFALATGVAIAGGAVGALLGRAVARRH
jgi:hypothetical protein